MVPGNGVLYLHREHACIVGMMVWRWPIHHIQLMEAGLVSCMLHACSMHAPSNAVMRSIHSRAAITKALAMLLSSLFRSLMLLVLLFPSLLLLLVGLPLSSCKSGFEQSDEFSLNCRVGLRELIPRLTDVTCAQCVHRYAVLAFVS